MGPVVTLEPRLALRQRRLGQRGAVHALEHAGGELRDQRPLGQAVAADGRDDRGGHSSAIEQVRDERRPPEPATVAARDHHLPARPGKERRAADAVV